MSEKLNNTEIIPNFSDSKYGMTPETKQKVFEKMKEMWLKTPKNDDFNEIEMDLHENWNINNIEEIIKNVIDYKQEQQDIKLRQTFKWLHVKEYYYNENIIKSYAEWFEKSNKEITEAIINIFENKFWVDVGWWDYIKKINMLKLLEEYFNKSNPEKLWLSPVEWDWKNIKISPYTIDINKNIEKSKWKTIFLDILKNQGIIIKNTENIENNDNKATYFWKDASMSISNENWKWIKDLINLLNDSVQKYSVKTLLSSPPTIIFVIWDEVFNISTKTNLSKEEQEMWKNIIWDWNNSEIEWISPSTIESNIEKERKTNIKKSLLKWLEKNGYNNIDFVGTDKKTREQLLDDMVEIINKKEKKSEVFIKNSIIEWPISQSIAKTLKVYENKQTYKTWNDLKDFIK